MAAGPNRLARPALCERLRNQTGSDRGLERPERELLTSKGRDPERSLLDGIDVVPHDDGISTNGLRKRPRVVVVGAGFGGLNVVRALGDKDVDVLVLDRNNYHGFWPFLYQVATASLEPESIAYPVRGIFKRYRNVRFRMGEVRDLDLDRREVVTDEERIPYDYLVVAAGSETNYFGNRTFAENALPLKDVHDAERLRNCVLEAFERAARDPDPSSRKRLLTFVIVGGGPTGVELAGALAELIRGPLRGDFTEVGADEPHVSLVEALDRILPSFPRGLQAYARRRLQALGVRVVVGKSVSAIEQGLVRLADGEQIAAETVVWTAGVRAAAVTAQLPVEPARDGRIFVEPALNLARYPEVFVVGDAAHVPAPNASDALPMIAPVAIQQGRHAARNILAAAEGREMRPFRYQDKGQLAVIGRGAAVMDALGIHLTGLVAWVGWLFLHLLYLIGFRNRAVVLTNWAFAYATYSGGLRVIVRNRSERRVESEPAPRPNRSQEQTSRVGGEHATASPPAPTPPV